MFMTPSRLLLIGILTLMLMLSGLRLNLDSGIIKGYHHHTRSLLDHSDSLEVEKHHVSNATPSPSKKGFVLSLQYPGQQGAGIRALGSLQCFLGSMTSYLVIAEPCLEDTKLRGISLTDDKLKLSSLFDLDFFNTASKRVQYPELVSIDTFILQRPKPVILVNTNHQKENKVVWTSRPSTKDAINRLECLSDSEISNFSSLEQDTVTGMISSMRRLESKTVCVVRVINLDTKAESFDRFSLRNFIFGEWQPEDVTLSFDKWSGRNSVFIPNPAHGMDCKKMFTSMGTELQFKPSQRLLQDAEKYKKAYLRGNRTIAMMFRMEKITNRATKTSETGKQNKIKYSIPKIEKCIADVRQLQQTLDEKDESVPLVTMDVGNFGSRSLKGNPPKIRSMANYTITTLYHNKWTVSEWEKSYTSITRGEKNKAYMAALQRTLASTADCLVLVGGGNFQALALQDYMRNHRGGDTLSANGGGQDQRRSSSRNKPCVHVLCATRKNEALINQILQRHHS